jgi:hypothetical protein
MTTMSYEQARALRDLLGRIDDDEEGTLAIAKLSIGSDLTIDFTDGRFEISGGGTVERV